MGPIIVEKQNTAENFRRLAAQRELYSTAKRLLGVQIILTTIVVVFLSGLNTLIEFEIDNFIAVYCVLITLFDVVFLHDYIISLKERAASIQETFDTDVLDISWNPLIATEDHEIVHRYSKKYKKRNCKPGSLENWYSLKIASIDSGVARIICQRSNCSYDAGLRKAFLVALGIVAGASLLLIFLFELSKAATLTDFVIGLLFPLLPVLVFFVRTTKEHLKSISLLNRLQTLLSDSWNSVLRNNPFDVDFLSRQIQDGIYANRKTSPLVFDWFYNKIRPRLEGEMDYAVDQLVQEFNSTQQLSLS